jgi:hypothetical protein
MRISYTLVEQFRILYQLKYGVSIDYETAESHLKELAKLIRSVAPKQDELKDE